MTAASRAGKPTPVGAVTVAAAAATLGVTASRVRQMLDIQPTRLTGPPSSGRGSQRWVWGESVEHERRRRKKEDPQGLINPSPEDPNPQLIVSSLLARTERLEADLTRLDGDRVRMELENGRLRAMNSDLRFAILQVNAAAAALEDASREEAEAFQLQSEAMTHHLRAAEALRRAERAREAAMAPLLIQPIPD